MNLSEFRIIAKEIENGLTKNRRAIEEAMNKAIKEKTEGGE